MPHVHALWQNGMKFAGHYTAASACSPARGTLLTGLYSQQSWLLQTIKAGLGTKITSPTPPLNPVFPTFGKLLRRAGYETPYVGKWHVSIPSANQNPLANYGFDLTTFPDPDGANLQGTVGDEANGYHNDQYIENQATKWLGQRKTSDSPWCLTVSFVNPHDQQFFWAGTEFQTYNNLFPSTGSGLQPILQYSLTPPIVAWNADPLKSPTPQGFPTLPPNWESAATSQANKPTLQYFSRLFSDAIWGGISDDPNQKAFSVAPFPPAPYTATNAIGVAPYSYWQRNMDSYVHVMSIVDQHIGNVLGALPASVAKDTVVVFTSDHGEYNGAHGVVAGKIGSVYEEPFHIPLIVVDPTGRFTADHDTIRTGLTSSVDMLRLFVTLGHNGSTRWLRGNLAQIYGQRPDILSMLRSASAAGRDHILLATDELVPGFYLFNNPAAHVAGVRTPTAKLGTYAKWHPLTGQIRPNTLEVEFYDYATARGVAETHSTPHDPRAAALLHELTSNLIPNELRAPLPGIYGLAQAASREVYLLFQAAILNIPANGFSGADLRSLLGIGQEF